MLHENRNGKDRQLNLRPRQSLSNSEERAALNSSYTLECAVSEVITLNHEKMVNGAKREVQKNVHSAKIKHNVSNGCGTIDTNTQNNLVFTSSVGN